MTQSVCSAFKHGDKDIYFLIYLKEKKISHHKYSSFKMVPRPAVLGIPNYFCDPPRKFPVVEQDSLKFV